MAKILVVQLFIARVYILENTPPPQGREISANVICQKKYEKEEKKGENVKQKGRKGKENERKGKVNAK
jgi:hypothetical protein